LVLPHSARRAVKLAFDASGRTLAIAGPRDLEWLHVATGQRMGSFRATLGRGVISEVGFAPDGSTMFAVSVAPDGRGMICRFDAKPAD
jgi:hypothetical protein